MNAASKAGDAMVTELLIIDDDEELCELLTDYLGREGFAVAAAHDGTSGLEQALESPPAMVLLDVMLPGANGFDVLRRLRERSSVPVLMLTARGDDVDRIVGLEMGADDYLPKPFNPRELVARIRAIQRRMDAAAGAAGVALERPPAPVVVGDVTLNPATRAVTAGGEEVALTALEFNLLEALLRSSGRVVTREDLSERVLGRPFSPFDRSLDVHVSNLRRKLGREGEGAERIKTIRGVGYQYTGD
jgi:two-component system, OmpR family, response regulator CpxR